MAENLRGRDGSVAVDSARPRSPGSAETTKGLGDEAVDMADPPFEAGLSGDSGFGVGDTRPSTALVADDADDEAEADIERFIERCLDQRD